jgi:hypothetical protein
MNAPAATTRSARVAPPPGTSTRARSRAALRCSVVAAAIFGVVAVFQLVLAAGVPWGQASWGGGKAELGGGLRAASAVQAVLFGGFALVVLRRAGHRVWAPIAERWLPAAVWILAGYMTLGTAMNAASRSSVERFWTPVALSLAVLCAVVAVTSGRRVRTRE